MGSYLLEGVYHSIQPRSVCISADHIARDPYPLFSGKSILPTIWGFKRAPMYVKKSVREFSDLLPTSDFSHGYWYYYTLKV